MKTAALLLLITGLVCAQSEETQIVVSGHSGGDHNAQTIRLRQTSGPAIAAKSAAKGAITWPGDLVIPQLVDGAGWKTTLMFHNLESKTVRFAVYFLDDNGNDLSLTWPALGTGTVMRFSVPASATVMVDTQGTADKLAQGWAFIAPEVPGDALASMAVFRSQAAGRGDQEAVVPVANLFTGRFVLMYDNTQGFTTSMAITNPSTRPAGVELTLRDETGQMLRQRTMGLTPFQHQAFSLPSAWPEVANKKGSIEFRVTDSTVGVGALGLRFHPSGSFTSFQTLERPEW